MKVQNEIEVTYVLYVYITIILDLLDNIYIQYQFQHKGEEVRNQQNILTRKLVVHCLKKENKTRNMRLEFQFVFCVC